MVKSEFSASGKPKKSDEIGRRLLELRKCENLTQEEMGKRLSISTQGYRNYESGDREPPAKVLFIISRVFSVDVAWLYDGVGPGPELRHKGGAPGLWNEAIILVERNLNKTERTLSPESKAKVVGMVVQYMIDGGKTPEAFAAGLVEIAA
jgi:transcriptional regulator with XRE-family HTH domain